MTNHARFPLPVSTTADADMKAAEVAVLPIGSYEQHGPHMPMATDTLIAVAVCDALAEEAHAAGIAVRQLPPITIGCSHEHADFAGTVSISATTLAAVVADIAESLALQGSEYLVIVNGHGGNYVLANLVQEVNAKKPGAMALFPNRADWADAREAAGMLTDGHEDMHAGELEGSLLLAAWPEWLKSEWIEAWNDDDHTSPDRRLLLTHGIRAYTASGIIGRPSLATADKGYTALRSLGENGLKMMKALTKDSSSH